MVQAGGQKGMREVSGVGRLRVQVHKVGVSINPKRNYNQPSKIMFVCQNQQ